MRRLFAPLLVALFVAGCAGSLPSITNPITDIDVYRLKLAYDTTLKLSNRYRDYCYASPYPVLMADPISAPVCKDRRKVVRAIQKYQPPAGTAVRYVENFVKNNPTLGVASVIGPAWDAVTAFTNVVPRTPGGV